MIQSATRRTPSVGRSRHLIQIIAYVGQEACGLETLGLRNACELQEQDSSAPISTRAKLMKILGKRRHGLHDGSR